MEFFVSVIIPVYNGEHFIEKAVVTALEQPEVSEVIVVNDGSTDNTLQVVEKLRIQEQRVQIFHHNNNQNKGRPASRNLGLKKATNNFIAFLDADDFYLENRFENDKKIFKEYPNTDGVYNAIGAHFYRDAEPLEIEKLKLTTVTSKIRPEDLFETLLYYKKGHFSIDGLTVKKSIFNETGYFDESLKVSEDTHLILKMALKCQLHVGIIDRPVAMRGVHQSNVFNNEGLYEENKIRVYESLVFWASKSKVDLDKIDHLLNILWIFKFRRNESILKNVGYWLLLNMKSPRLLLTKLSIKYFPVVRLRKKLFPFLYK
ncbi:glycosyltransferase [Sabulilitoribacter multivorans]|uniref:Glycosyltransferase n=1 Tax=Flaviramulus multivorans TaxID=1304750 RepID=A0ABS9IHX3_9FLAO|nr:glycosyltransferase family 2 protein [Flaviramulus multivorans]MCF7560324.1 glycosyltransferase [Flaviramulus multivorans]